MTGCHQKQPAASASEHRLPVGLIALMAALAAMQPMAIDGISPALPDIARNLAVAPAQMPAAMSALVIAFAVSQLVFGIVADRFGRRPVVIGGLALFTMASGLAAAAPSFPLFIAARALQGVGAAAAVLLARTIVRDLLPRDAAARALAIIGALFGTMPMIAPALGGVLVATGGWRAPLLAMGLAALLICMLSLRQLPETLPRTERRPVHPIRTFTGLARMARDPALLSYAVPCSFAYSGILLFSAVAPGVLIGSMGLSATAYGFAFALSTSGFIVGNMVAHRLLRRHTLDEVLRRGTLCQLAGGLLMLAAVVALPGHWWTLVLPHIVFSLGWGMGQPQMQAGALSTHPGAIGQASALFGFIQLAGAGLFVYLFQNVGGRTAASLAIGMVISGLGSTIFAQAGRRRARR